MSRGARGFSIGHWTDFKPAASVQFDSEFDFEVENAKFDKEHIEKEMKENLSLSLYFT